MDRQIDGEIDRQMDGWMDRQMNIWTDRQMAGQTHTHLPGYYVRQGHHRMAGEHEEAVDLALHDVERPLWNEPCPADLLHCVGGTVCDPRVLVRQLQEPHHRVSLQPKTRSVRHCSCRRTTRLYACSLMCMKTHKVYTARQPSRPATFLR